MYHDPTPRRKRYEPGPIGPIPHTEPAVPDPHCLTCGYNLRGICTPDQPTGHCPECGEGFDKTVIERFQGHVTRRGELLAQIIAVPAFHTLVYVAFMVTSAHVVHSMVDSPTIWIELSIFMAPMGVLALLCVWHSRYLAFRVHQIRALRRGESANLTNLPVGWFLLFTVLEIVLVHLYIGLTCASLSVVA